MIWGQWPKGVVETTEGTNLLSESMNPDEKAKKRTLENPAMKGWGQRRRYEKTRLRNTCLTGVKEGPTEVCFRSHWEDKKSSVCLDWPQADERFAHNSEGFHSAIELGFYGTIRVNPAAWQKIWESRSHNASGSLLFLLKEHLLLSSSDFSLLPLESTSGREIVKCCLGLGRTRE